MGVPEQVYRHAVQRAGGRRGIFVSINMISQCEITGDLYMIAKILHLVQAMVIGSKTMPGDGTLVRTCSYIIYGSQSD